ncbi:MAG: redoxin domain-containing protein [Planctomycetota bacterium]|nr:MAG: redoxin domain-containing protein [Planctomycetota bacterium]
MNESESTVWTRLPDPGRSDSHINIGLSVAALVLGIVSIAVAIIVTGAVFGLVGAILGTVALAGKSSGKKMAGWGLALSISGILLSCFFALAFYAARVKKPYIATHDTEQTAILSNWIGKQAPDFALKDVEGNDIKLSQLKGRRVVMTFWSPWWLRDRDAIPHLIRLRNSASEKELAIIGVSTDKAEEVGGVGQQLGINFPLVSSDQLPIPFDQIYSTPTTIFIDTNGIIQSILDEYHDFEKINQRALTPDYEKEHAEESSKITSSNVSDE